VLGAAYEPGSASAKVGGDWYDAFALPEGDLGVVVGDVMGHDVAAAAAMGQLRSVLRSCAVDGDPPAAVLDRLDRLVNSFAMADLATVVYARLHRRPDGSADLTYANAGHPPPLVLLPDGTTRALASGASTMIGVPGEQRRNEAVEHLPLGSALLMFTDGLVERRGGDIEEELSQLAVQAAELWQRSTPQELCDALIATVRRSDQTDDAAALVVHLA
jgi:serine phosphatase RsbU (regulator of sigma subunit)